MKLAGIVVCGAAGRMGRMVAQAAEEARVPVLGGLERRGHGALGGRLGRGFIVDDLRELDLPRAAVAVEFSAPEALAALLPALLGQKLALVSGTTGVPAALQARIRQAARKIAVLRAGNFSRGVVLMKKALRLLGALVPDDFDVEIVETHHSKKQDAPSGTALELFHALNSDLSRFHMTERPWGRGLRRPRSVGMHSLRGGSVPGEHTVGFYGPAESLRFTHVAESRESFAKGAVEAAKFLAGKKPGLYKIEDIYA